MKVLVDTCIWSLALRRPDGQPLNPVVAELAELIRESRVQLIGPVRQEILSGVRSVPQFVRLRDQLRAFPDLPLESADHERAAELFNACRAKGVRGSNTDLLICAMAERCRLSVFTTDHDFECFAQHIPVRLHALRREGAVPGPAPPGTDAPPHRPRRSPRR